MATWPYSTTRWKKARRLVLTRDGHHCQIGGPGCQGAARSVDHIREVSAGGALFDLANLRAACVSCNSAKANDRRFGKTPEPHSEDWHHA